MAHPDTRLISFTHPSVASMWVVTLHNLFLYSDPPLLCHPSSYWLRLFSSQTFSHINTPTFSNPVILHTYPPMKMEQIECSEMTAYKIQTQGNYPEESIQHSEHGESLKSRIINLLQCFKNGYDLMTVDCKSFIITTNKLRQRTTSTTGGLVTVTSTSKVSTKFSIPEYPTTEIHYLKRN